MRIFVDLAIHCDPNVSFGVGTKAKRRSREPDLADLLPFRVRVDVHSIVNWTRNIQKVPTCRHRINPRTTMFRVLCRSRGLRDVCGLPDLCRLSASRSSSITEIVSLFWIFRASSRRRPASKRTADVIVMATSARARTSAAATFLFERQRLRPRACASLTIGVPFGVKWYGTSEDR